MEQIPTRKWRVVKRQGGWRGWQEEWFCRLALGEKKEAELKKIQEEQTCLLTDLAVFTERERAGLWANGRCSLLKPVVCSVEHWDIRTRCEGRGGVKFKLVQWKWAFSHQAKAQSHHALATQASKPVCIARAEMEWPQVSARRIWENKQQKCLTYAGAHACRMQADFIRISKKYE